MEDRKLGFEIDEQIKASPYDPGRQANPHRTRGIPSMSSSAGLPRTDTRRSRVSERVGYGLQIGQVLHSVGFRQWIFTQFSPRYRTLSIRVEEKDLPAKPKASTDPADAIAAIDVHLITVEDVFTRYSTHPTHGLEAAAVLRKEKDGKNTISPPPTQYWKKALNYVFGGFNFLMWIAFILTLVSALLPLSD